jgi:predicted signal transduction protein with EAL and GGDEF domain
VLASYRKAGIRFAIDDLGEGFATTDLLATAQPEFVKLARSLTVSSSRRSSRVAINAALSFAHAHDAAVIAEGVENELVSDQIRSLNIPLGQGFGLGRPTIAADLLDSMAAWSARETMRPLRPRNAPPRIRVAATQTGAGGPELEERRRAPQSGSRRVTAASTPRLVRRSESAASGEAS